MAEDLLHLSESSLKDARRCSRLYFYRWVEGRIPIDVPDALTFGRVWHVGQEAYWRMRKALQSGTEKSARDLELAKDGRDPLAYAVANVRDLASDPKDPARVNRRFESIKIEVEIMMIGYDVRWGGDGLRVVAVEKRFEGPLVNPESKAASRTWMLVGQLDVVVEQNVGDRWRRLLMEHKTTSHDIDAGGTYAMRLAMDSQVSMYHTGCKVLGYDVEGCVYDVAKKIGKRPYPATPPSEMRYTKGTACKCATVDEASRTAVHAKDDCVKCGGSGWKEAPRPHAGCRLTEEPLDEYRDRLLEAVSSTNDGSRWFERFHVVRLKNEIREFQFDVWQSASMLREMRRLKQFPKNPDACENYGRLCEYFSVCVGQANLADGTRFRDRRTIERGVTSGD